MNEKRTVFVLGAGASCPYGFPTGRGLRAKIVGEFVSAYEFLLDQRKKLGVDGINEGYPSPSEARRFATVFDESSTESIDLFLSRHPQFEKIGKIAIALMILKAEHSSHFRERMKNPGEDWYFHLFNGLMRGFVGRDGYRGFGNSNAAFITLNYDRSLEYFLFNSLLHAFEGADPVKVEEQILRVPMIHVYGRIAPLKLRDNSAQELPLYGLRYGKHVDDFSGIDLLGDIKYLQVVHEERTNPELEIAHKQIEAAERIFFLGFGYAKENLEALGLPGILKPTQLVYGTTMGFTLKETTDLQLLLAEGLRYPQKPTEDTRRKVHLKDCDCVALLREFL